MTIDKIFEILCVDFPLLILIWGFLAFVGYAFWQVIKLGKEL